MSVPRHGMEVEAVVVGVSAGGMHALNILLSGLPAEFPAALIIVQHRAPSDDAFFVTYLSSYCPFPVKEAEDKEPIWPGICYIAPAGYHLLVEKEKMFSLSADEPVNYARPSIDVLFETAAEAYREALVGVILTGSNMDGSWGTIKIRRFGGLTVAQDPLDAEVSAMPQAAIDTGKVDVVLPLGDIPDYLAKLFEE